jgi:hypothetical protein
MTVYFSIRGKEKQIVTQCKNLGDVLDQGNRLFPDFDQRNPWVFGDSVQKRVYVVLDPETETLTNPVHKRKLHA